MASPRKSRREGGDYYMTNRDINIKHHELLLALRRNIRDIQIMTTCLADSPEIKQRNSHVNRNLRIGYLMTLKMIETLAMVGAEIYLGDDDDIH